MVEYTQNTSHEQEREYKQNYLVENVVNLGYDTDLFATYMNSQRGKHLHIRRSNIVFCRGWDKC